MANKCSNPDCELGWIFRKYLDKKSVKLRTGETREIVTEYEGAFPCPDCNSAKAEIFATAQSSDELQEALQNRSVHKRLAAYEKAEDSKTKVL